MERSHRTSDVVADIGPGVYIRPLEPADRAGVADLFRRLSPESRRRRFLTPKPELSQRELTYLTVADHRWREALGAIEPAQGSIVGVGHYGGEFGRLGAADVAVVVADEWQQTGIGTALGRALIARARANGFHHLTATTMWDNRAARALLRGLGFYARASKGSLIELELDL